VRKQIRGIVSLKGAVALERIQKMRSRKILKRVFGEIVEKGLDGDWESDLAVPATFKIEVSLTWHGIK